MKFMKTAASVAIIASMARISGICRWACGNQIAHPNPLRTRNSIWQDLQPQYIADVESMSGGAIDSRNVLLFFGCKVR